jgi:hypothetical protein
MRTNPLSDTASPEERQREVLRQASVALRGRVVTLWEASSRAEVVPVLTSMSQPPYHDTVLDLDQTLQRWGAPVSPGSRWVGCRLDDAGTGAWHRCARGRPSPLQGASNGAAGSA